MPVALTAWVSPTDIYASHNTYIFSPLLNFYDKKHGCIIYYRLMQMATI